MAFEETIKKLERLRRLDINRLIQEVIQEDKELQEFILDLNRKDQLFLKSEDSEGIKLGDIGGGYSPFTEQVNKGVTFSYKGVSKVKLTGGDPFLFDSGEFYESFRLIVALGFIEILANPIKDGDNLFDDFGENIIGLQDESIDKLSRELAPKVANKIRQKILR